LSPFVHYFVSLRGKKITTKIHKGYHKGFTKLIILEISMSNYKISEI